MKFDVVAYNKRDTYLHWLEVADFEMGEGETAFQGRDEFSHEMTGTQDPHQDFKAALQAFASPLVKMIGHFTLATPLEIQRVSIDFDNDAEPKTISIVAIKAIESHKPLNVNVNKIDLESFPKFAKLLEPLWIEAEGYFRRKKRANFDLFAAAEEAEAKDRRAAMVAGAK